MLFFSKSVYAFNKGITILFQLSNDEDDTQGKEQGEKEGIEATTEGNNKQDSSDAVSDSEKQYWILSLMKTYADFTNNRFEDIWDKNVIEFFNMIAFIKEYKRREQEEIKKLQRKQNLKL